MVRRGVLGLCLAQMGCGRVAFEPVAGDGGNVVAADRYAAAVLADSPTAYWRLGEASGTVARDELGAYPAIYQGGCTLGVSGALAVPGTAVAFDGTSCRIDAGDVFAFAGAAAFTIELWAKIGFADGNSRFLVQRDSSAGPRSGYQLPFQDSALWFEKITGIGGVGYLAVGAPQVGRFEMIVVTFDGTVERLYRDGVEVGTTTPTLTTAPSAGRLVFGDTVDGQVFKLDGVLDEIAVYDHALPASRIAAHFAAR